MTYNLTLSVTDGQFQSTAILVVMVINSTQLCMSSQCLNGGTCVISSEPGIGHQCICPTGYRGVNCGQNDLCALRDICGQVLQRR